MLLSSTTSDKEVMTFAKGCLPDPITIQLSPEEMLENIKQFYVGCRNKEDKVQALSDLYGVESIGQCIVFCQVRTSSLM